MRVHRSLGTAAAACLLLAVACSSSRVSATKPATPGPSAGTARADAVRAPAGAPTVRMFAGVQSAVGSVAQYCVKAPCSPRGVPAHWLAVAAGAIVTFAVQPAPDQAVLTVSGPGTAQVPLSPGTLLAYPGRLAPGAHRLSLQLRWGQATGVWVWDASVAAS